MIHSAVIGLGWGDEGKGLTTDYLCRESLGPQMVVRFNGGQQAGHTVVINGLRHVFSNFGSGSLREIPTYWSKFCTVDPIGLMNEFDVLKSIDVNPFIYIDSQCPITTPFDIAYNRLNTTHGTVGLGFGATVERELNFYSLTFEDLFYPQVLKTKLGLIADYYFSKTGVVDCSQFLSACAEIVDSKNIIKQYGLPNHINYKYIFEGAQGLLLDQHYGFYPNVTWSNTGSKNIKEIIPHMIVDYYLVTRAYQTRHGNGFMSNENNYHIIPNPNETNVSHKYQGNFRTGILDVSLIEYAINKDENIKNSMRKNLVITCLDQLSSFKFLYKEKIVECKNEDHFVCEIVKHLKYGGNEFYNILTSNTEESKNISKVSSTSCT